MFYSFYVCFALTVGFNTAVAIAQNSPLNGYVALFLLFVGLGHFITDVDKWRSK
jgi:hypothetical protein